VEEDDQELIEWVDQISDRRKRNPGASGRTVVNQREHLEILEWLSHISTAHEAQWDPAKHPRAGTSPNPGWFASSGGGGSIGGDPSDPSQWYLPSDDKGKWIKGTKGEGTFRLKTPVDVNGKLVNEIKFTHGAPVLDGLLHPSKTATIILTGDRTTDLANATTAWKKLNPGEDLPKNWTFHHDLLHATEETVSINGKKTKVLVGKMHLIPTKMNNAVFHEGTVSVAKKYYQGIAANTQSIKELAKKEAKLAGEAGSIVTGALGKIKANKVARGLRPLVGRAVFRLLPLATTGLAIVEFSGNVKAHGIGGAVARATPVLGDLIAAHDLGSDIAKGMIEDARAAENEEQRRLNAHLLPAWERANEQAIAAFDELGPQIKVTNQPRYEDGSLVDSDEIAHELDNYRTAMYHANILHATRKDFDFKASAARHKQNLKQGLERASQKRAPLKRGPLT
jgi:hypothetical protein